MNAIVLGAGPAGLAAAQVLADGGARVVVLEARPRVGGLAGSERVGGHAVDLGPHRLHLAADERTRSLLGHAGLVERARQGALHVAGRVVRYPLRPRALLRDAGPATLARFASGALRARVRPPGGEDYAAETRRRVGDAVFGALYGPAAKKVWGVAPEGLDGAQARVRVGAASPLALLRRAFGGGEPGRYLYPAGGANQRAYDAWAERLRAAGVELCLGARAGAVRVEGRRVRGVDGLDADVVVSTLPLTGLLAALSWPAPQLRSRTVVLLHLVVARPRFGSEDVRYFPDEGVPFARITEQRAFGAEASAPAGETALTLDFYDWPGGRWTAASPEALLDAAWPTLAGLGLGRGEVRLARKTVADDAYPVLERGYRAARDAALDRLAGVEGLYSTGRGGLFLHVNQHHAVEMGLAAGEAALRGESGAAWRAEARRFEGLRIVD